MLVTDGKAEPVAPETTDRKTLKALIDIVSAISIFLMFVVFPILGHYYPNSKNAAGDLTFLTKLTIGNFPLCCFGAGWLLFRNFKNLCGLAVRHPTIFGTRHKLLRTAGLMLIYLAGYLVIKNTLFRWVP